MVIKLLPSCRGSPAKLSSLTYLLFIVNRVCVQVLYYAHVCVVHVCVGVWYGVDTV